MAHESLCGLMEASGPASASGRQTPDRQTRPILHCSVRVHGSSTSFGAMLTPQPSNASTARKDEKRDRRRIIASTIAQLSIQDHARRIKHC